jgi:hypothetical protein
MGIGTNIPPPAIVSQEARLAQAYRLAYAVVGRSGIGRDWVLHEHAVVRVLRNSAPTMCFHLV